METGTTLRHLVLFNKGQPTSDMTYVLTNQDGSTLDSGTVTISSGQVSHEIVIDAADNVISKPLIEQMKLSWSYTTATESISEEYRYRLHAAIEFPVSADSVRNMLGVCEEEVPDRDVDLLAGYLAFRQEVPATTDFTALASAGDFDTYRIATAIEAATALNLFTTLQVRLPRAYDSGTSSYERWNSIDWDTLQMELSTKFNDGLSVIDENIDLLDPSDVFGLSTPPTDVITGA